MLSVIRSGVEVFAPPGRRARWAWVVVVAVTLAAIEYITAVLVFGVLDQALSGEGVSSLSLSVPVPDVSQTTLLVIAGIAFLLREALGVFSVYVTESVVQTSASEVSARLHRRYLYAPYRFHLTRDSAEMVRTTVLSVDRAAGEVVRPTIVMVTQVPIILTLTTLLIVTSPVLTLAALGAVSVFLFVLLRVIQPRLRRLGTLSENVSTRILNSLNDSFRSLREVKTYGSEPFFDRRFAESREIEAKLRIERFTLAAVPSRALEFIVLAGLLTLIGFATSGDSFASIIPTLGVFAYATLRVVPSVNRVVSSANIMRFGQQAIENVAADLTDSEPATTVHESRPTTEPILGSAIVLDSVRFSYPGDRGVALDDVNLRIEKGETVAVVGSSGAGKSTLIDILLGLLDPDAGHRLVDGAPELPRGWKSGVGVVSQNVIIVNGSLRDNVTFGSADADDQRVMSALEKAQLSDWVDQLPSGLDTNLGEGGKLVSGGQRQRVAIARSLYRDPELLILDEATSDLDAATETAILSALGSTQTVVTTVIVSHRMAPITAADKVVLMGGGRILAVGDYDTLLAGHPEFKTLIQA